MGIPGVFAQGFGDGVVRTLLAINRRLATETDLQRAMQALLEAAVTLAGGLAIYDAVQAGRDADALGMVLVMAACAFAALTLAAQSSMSRCASSG